MRNGRHHTAVTGRDGYMTRRRRSTRGLRRPVGKVDPRGGGGEGRVESPPHYNRRGCRPRYRSAWEFWLRVPGGKCVLLPTGYGYNFSTFKRSPSTYLWLAKHLLVE